MKANMMRTPLLKSAVVLLFLVILVYLTSASPEGSVLNSVGQIIIGAFRLVQWAIAMAIGLTVSIAFLFGVFLFAVFLVNRESAAAMYQSLKGSIAILLQPVFTRIGAFQCRETVPSPQPAVQTPPAPAEPREDLKAIIVGEVKKVTETQQSLHDQFTALSSKIDAMETRSSELAAASAAQLETITAELAASGMTLAAVQENVTKLENKLNDTTRQMQAITPEKLLGDLPARLDKLEHSAAEPGFDPAPLNASIELLHKEMEELKKKPTPGKTKKKS